MKSLCKLGKGSTLLFASLFLLANSAYGGDVGEPGVHWVGSWAASQQLVEPANALATEDLRDATLRQIVHLSVGGAEIRLRLSNRFGATSLHVTSVHVARPISASSGKIVHAVTRRSHFPALRK